MSDVVVSAPARTYPLPKAVVESAVLGRRWQHAYVTEASDADFWAAGLLEGGGAVTAGMVALLAAALPEQEDWSKDDRSSEHVRYVMHGGTPLERWARKILAAQQRENDVTVTAALELAGYDDSFTYLGILDESSESIIRSLVRLTDPMSWEAWTAGEAEWEPVIASGSYRACVLDRGLVAATVIALKSSEGLELKFEAPLARLPYEPMIASAPVSDDPPGAKTFAIVDPTDQTAVMDVVRISPGPKVEIRSGGKWVDSPERLKQLIGVAPPPLVQLDGQTLQMVLAQLDGKIQQAQQDPSYVESKAPVKSSSAPGPVTASVIETRRCWAEDLATWDAKIQVAQRTETEARAKFDAELVALRAHAMADFDEVWDAESARREAAQEALDGLLAGRDLCSQGYRRSLISRTAGVSSTLREKSVALSVLASAKMVTADEGSSDSSMYWVRDRGALRVRWGCKERTSA